MTRFLPFLHLYLGNKADRHKLHAPCNQRQTDQQNEARTARRTYQHVAYTVACVQLKSHRNVKQLGTIRTRPIAISRVLRAISDRPKNGWTDQPTDQHHLSANIIKVVAI